MIYGMLYGHSEFPAASYDAWKTTPPDYFSEYEEEHEPEPDCGHCMDVGYEADGVLCSCCSEPITLEDLEAIQMNQDYRIPSAPIETPAEEPAPEYARVEVFGHNIHVGRISEVERYGTKMLRVDVPKGIFENGFLTYLLGGAAIFRMTPCDLAYVERFNRDQTPPALLTVQPEATEQADDSEFADDYD